MFDTESIGYVYILTSKNCDSVKLEVVIIHRLSVLKKSTKLNLIKN